MRALFYLALASGCHRGRTPRPVVVTPPLLAVARCGEGRLEAAPWRPAAQGCGAQPLDPAFVIAARAARSMLLRHATASNLRMVAIAELIAGRIDLALTELTRAADLAPRSAALWNDLSAAHLQRADTAAEPYEAVLALAAAERAVALAPAMAAALFNRALALDRLGLRLQAVAAWHQATAAEHDPLWRSEAQVRAASLARPPSPEDEDADLRTVTAAVQHGRLQEVEALVARSHQRCREYVEDSLLGSWAAAATRHHTVEAERDLKLARAIAAALAADGDPLASETVAAIDRATLAGPGPQRAWTAALRAYRDGVEAAMQDRCSLALPQLAIAQATLADSRSPFAGRARVWMALCHYQHADYPAAQRVLSAEIEKPGSGRYRALRGRCLWLRGLIDGIQGRSAPSIAAFRAAEADFRAVHESANSLRLDALVADALGNLGEVAEAWRYLAPALRQPLAEPRDRLSIVEIASWLAQDDGEWQVALRFQGESVRCSRMLHRPDLASQSLRVRAVLLARLNREGESARDLAQARDLQSQVPDAAARRVLEGDLLRTEGELVASRSPAVALAKLDAATLILRATTDRHWLGRVLHERGVAEITLQRNDEAERDLAGAIAELERQREAITLPEERISYLDHARDLFLAMIAFQLEQRHRPDRALWFSEQAKARVLLDWMRASPVYSAGKLRVGHVLSWPASPRRLQRDLPPGITLVEYAVLRGEIVIWAFRRTGEIRCRVTRLPETELAALVARLRHDAQEGDGGDRIAVSERLFAALIAPVAGGLEPRERLAFVPDGILHSLPFALLRDPATHRYLGEDHPWSVAPSARIFAASSRREAALAGGGAPRALVVAAPAFDPTLDPSLAPLRSGETEEVIAGRFAGSRALRGSAATRQAFLAVAGDFQIVHFGGHTLIDWKVPLRSRMLFAAQAGDPERGALYSGDVLHRRFSHTHLVVLASCDTGSGRVSHTEGVENLARSFLAAGVPAVIASLWPVDDDLSAAFFAIFYRHLAQGLDIASALGASQAEAAAREHDPGTAVHVWGAFEVVGAGGGITAGQR